MVEGEDAHGANFGLGYRILTWSAVALYTHTLISCVGKDRILDVARRTSASLICTSRKLGLQSILEHGERQAGSKSWH